MTDTIAACPKCGSTTFFVHEWYVWDGEVYAGTSSDHVEVFTKAGVPGRRYKCDDSVFSCAAAPGGKYVFAGDNASSVYCFDRAGARLW